ncbi:fanconi anemia group D2 protein isoform X2 [Wolffia australiana]
MGFLRRIPPSAGSRRDAPTEDVEASERDRRRSSGGSSTTSSQLANPRDQIGRFQSDNRCRSQDDADGGDDLRVVFSVLADAGCTLCSSGPPLLPADTFEFRRRLDRCFTSSEENPLLEQFLSGLSTFLSSRLNLRRFLVPAAREALSGTNGVSSKADSLARVLLLVASLQPRLQHLLLERLPEYFDAAEVAEDNIPRLIVNQFRWLDFVVDLEGLCEKLMEVLSICPFPLKKDIIGFLPEIIGNCGNSLGVVEALEKMLQEDSELVVPILDAFSNLNFSSSQLEQVVTVGLSCIRTVQAEHLPDLLRFLLISSDKVNVGRIILHIREQLKFFTLPDSLASRHKKLKGKSVADGTETSALEVLRSSLRFRNVLCDAILKELKGLNQSRDCKVIDVWFLVLLHINGGPCQKAVEKILKRKIVDGCILESLFDQCIQGQSNLVKEYFPSFLSLSEHLLTCNEEKARKFGIHLYTLLFGELTDSYSRLEVLSSLVTHVGSGVRIEVSSALEAMTILASNYSSELVALSSHVNGILDYLETFDDQNLRKVYEVFCLLSFSCRLNGDSPGSSISRELMILVRKQLGNPDMRYRKMGIFGTSKIVSALGDLSSSKENVDEALEFLKVSFDSCKHESSALILLYDEFTALVKHGKLQTKIMEWIGTRLGDFESIFITDLERGQLVSTEPYIGLEGDPWMNLDGDTSVICLNILPILSSSPEKSGQSKMQSLPAMLQLLSSVERSANGGSLEGIDALLGCPLLLPSHKFLYASAWNSLKEIQKKTIIFSLYYAVNWIRELFNAFGSQVTTVSGCLTQGLREETTEKLLKRLRNIIFLENLLNYLLKLHHVSLPPLNFDADMPDALPTNHKQPSEEKEGCASGMDTASVSKKRGRKKKFNATGKSGNDNMKQQTIVDAFERSGSLEKTVRASSTSSCTEKISQTVKHEGSSHPDHLDAVEMSEVPTVLYSQESKFRVLHADCLTLLSLSKQSEGSCCSDPKAELCLHLYLLRELHRRLDSFCPTRKPSPAHHVTMATDFLGKVRPLFLSLRKHLDNALSLLTNGKNAACIEHWKCQHASAGNPDLPSFSLSNALVGSFVCQEIFYCFGKIMNMRELFDYTNIPVLKDLLGILQPTSMPGDFVLSIEPPPSPGNIDFLYCGAFSFLEEVFNTACQNSLKLASEVVITLESLIKSIAIFLKFLEEGGKSVSITFSKQLSPLLQHRLGASACNLLARDWSADNPENPFKDKGKILPHIIQIYLRNTKSRREALFDLACSILPKASHGKSREQEPTYGVPFVCSSTFMAWYRTLHEENISELENLIGRICPSKKRKENKRVDADVIFEGLQQSVDVSVSLVQLCKTQNKVRVHALAVKYGAKFVDAFIKAFDFLEAHFLLHGDIIIQMVKDLQKATRTIQVLCSEAKRGAKQTMVSGRVPAAKRSLERFLFRVKAMLHNTSNGHSFWMGNLKHKDLLGQVVSSQLCADEEVSSP